MCVVTECTIGDCLLRGDSRDLLPMLPAESVQLVVTSPPYNVGWRYADDGSGDRRPLAEYLDLLGDCLVSCRRILRPGGVLALNLPPTIRTESHRAFPLGAWAEMQLAESNWLLREPVAWVKGGEGQEPVASGCAIGGPANPYLRAVHERVILASKDTYTIPNKRHWPKAARSYLVWCKDVWTLPAGRARPGQPVAFPDELVTRLVLLYSEPGDVVLDPFAGTGTVGRIARLHGRIAWLVEREPSYWPGLEAVLSQQMLFAGIAEDLRRPTRELEMW